MLILDPRKGFYALEAVRRAPEGTVSTLLENEEARQQFERLSSDLPELSRPVATIPSFPPGEWMEKGFGYSRFDHIILCEPLGRHDPGFDYWAYAESALAAGNAVSGVVFFNILGGKSSCLSEMLKLNLTNPDSKTAALTASVEAFERSYGGGPGLARDAAHGEEEKAEEIFVRHLSKAGIKAAPTMTVKCLSYQRSLSAMDIETWLSTERDYGGRLRDAIGQEAFSSLRELLGRTAGTVRWPLFVSLGKL